MSAVIAAYICIIFTRQYNYICTAVFITCKISWRPTCYFARQCQCRAWEVHASGWLHFTVVDQLLSLRSVHKWHSRKDSNTTPKMNCSNDWRPLCNLGDFRNILHSNNSVAAFLVVEKHEFNDKDFFVALWQARLTFCKDSHLALHKR